MEKTLFIISCFVLAIVSCTSPEKQAAGTATSTETTTSIEDTVVKIAVPAAEVKSEGEKLIAKNDCIGCHNKVQKVIGPAYVDIAAKYPLNDQNVKHLADKVITGGKDVWGEIPMTPHSNLSTADAKEMIRYILSLKK